MPVGAQKIVKNNGKYQICLWCYRYCIPAKVMICQRDCPYIPADAMNLANLSAWGETVRNERGRRM